MLSKTKFKKLYKALTPSAQRKTREYYEDLYKNAVLETTFDEAEKCLLWIREIEEE